MNVVISESLQSRGRFPKIELRLRSFDFLDPVGNVRSVARVADITIRESEGHTRGNSFIDNQRLPATPVVSISEMACIGCHKPKTTAGTLNPSFRVRCNPLLWIIVVRHKRVVHGARAARRADRLDAVPSSTVRVRTSCFSEQDLSFAHGAAFS